MIDAVGEQLLSARITNDEGTLDALIDKVLALADDGEVLWAVDINRGGAALLVGLLAARHQPVAFLTGLMMHRAAAGYRGEGKTDARDAFMIADQARVRRDINLLRPENEIAADLRILTARRLDVVYDRTRQINRLRAQLLEVCPALERALTVTNTGPLVLLTRYQTPAQIRRAGPVRIEAWLRKQHVRGAESLAQRAKTAAAAQRIVLAGEAAAAKVVARIAQGIIALDAEIAELDAAIEARFLEHSAAPAILSLPGFGPKIGVEFIAATGGDMSVFTGVNQLAGLAGLAPRPRDSGKISGNLHRPKRYHRTLLRTMYISAQVSIRHSAASHAFYQRKRSEGKSHKQAVIALARRRLNVLWAMLRDGTTYQDPRPAREPGFVPGRSDSTTVGSYECEHRPGGRPLGCAAS